MKRLRKTNLKLNQLETRETPATLVNATTLTYQDVDGDNVTVKLSKPLLTAANAPAIFTYIGAFASAGPQQLRTMNLTGLGVAATGAGITTSAVRSPLNGGDGFAALGLINATDIDLGTVIIDGDLGHIRAGDATTTTTGLASLKAQSMGRFGTSTGATNLITVIQGRLGALTVKADVKEAFIDVRGGNDGDIGIVTIGGSLLGGTADNSGRIRADGDIGILTIKGNLIGGAGAGSGEIFATNKLADVTIGGDLQGGAGNDSGRIFTQSGMGAVKITGNVIGGGGQNSARIETFGTLASATIGGDLIGGAGNFSGLISPDGALGSVKITGDVVGGAGDISGSVDTASTLASVTIGGDLQGGAGNNSGRIFSVGAMGAVRLTGNVIGGGGQDSGEVSTNSTLARVTIGGDLQGGAGVLSGGIFSQDAMGTVKIAGNVIGGGGASSGQVFANSTLASVTIGGDLQGGAGSFSGLISSSGAMGAVKLTGNVIGGGGASSGQVSTNSTLASVTIGGDLQGGAGSFSGHIFSFEALGAIKITGNMIGGSASAGDLQKSGYIEAQRIGTLTIGGSLIAGFDNTSGTFTNNGAIRVVDDIGTATIGNIIGNATNPAIVSARGQAVQTTTDLAIGKLTVKGRVEFAQILAGFDVAGVGVNADAQIGPVTVGGDWIASSLVAGAISGNGFFGDTGDAKIVDANDDPLVFSKIVRLTIGGQVLGTVGGADHFGIVAENVGVVKVGGTILPTVTGNSNDDFFVGITGDFNVNEV